MANNSERPDNIPAAQVAAKQDDVINIKEYLFWAWEKKWWILLSIFLCVCVAFYYLYVTPKSYVRSAQVMIKSDSRGRSGIAELEAFQDLNGFSGVSVDVMNEIQAFKSPILMERVVKRLGLDVFTYKHNLLRDEVLYNNAPVKVSFGEGGTPAGYTFEISKSSDTSVELSSFYYKGDRLGIDDITVSLNDTVETPIGKIFIAPTRFYADGFDTSVKVSCGSVHDVAKAFLRSLSVELAEKETSVINISITDNVISRADDIVNALIDVYNEEWISYMNEARVNTSNFINERLVIIENELNAVDTDVEEFKKENKLFDIPSEAQQTAEESSVYSSRYFDITNELAIAQYILDYLKDSNNNNSLLPSGAGIQDANVGSQIAEYNTTLLRYKALLENSSPSNPVVEDYNTSLEMMRSSIFRSISNLIATLQLQAKNIESRESQIRGKIEMTPTQAKELIDIERQQKVKESLYVYLLQKREENELSSSLVVDNTRIMSYATGSNAPVSPKTTSILVLAIAIGLIVPFIYKVVKDVLDSTVRGKKDLEALSAPFVGELPFVGVRKHFLCFMREVSAVSDENAIVVKDGSRDTVNEAFRVVRANLDFVAKRIETKSLVTLFTSYNVDSGKTFVAANLAATMSIKKVKVCLIDLDMRKATLSKTVQKTKTGVSSYLAGFETDVDNIICHHPDYPNLDVIPVGALPPNPAELLQGGRLDDLIAELRTRYDYIYIDCPPLNIVADTSVIARVADISIFVIRVGLMERVLVPEVEEIYRSNRLPNMVVLLNAVKERPGRYGYHRYGYNYGYGYGYGYTEKK